MDNNNSSELAKNKPDQEKTRIKDIDLYNKLFYFIVSFFLAATLYFFGSDSPTLLFKATITLFVIIVLLSLVNQLIVVKSYEEKEDKTNVAIITCLIYVNLGILLAAITLFLILVWSM